MAKGPSYCACGVQECLNAISKTQHAMQRINIYDIYADVCLPKHVHNEVTQLGLQLGQHPANNTMSIAGSGILGCLHACISCLQLVMVV